MQGKAACILIIAGGSRPDLDECLLSLSESDYVPSRTVIVDNSPDGLCDSIKLAFPRVHTLRPPRRLTFAQAVNLGITETLNKGEGLIFLLNDDVTIHAKTLSLLAAAERAQGPGVFAPEIWPYRGGLKRTRFAIDWKKRLITRIPVAVNGPLTPIDYAEASAVLVSASVVEKIGLFDEDFGFYYEDVDFSQRAAEAGFPVLEVEGARVWHKGSVSTGKGLSPFKAYYRARNTLKFAMKYRRRASLATVAAYHFGGFVLPEMARSASRALLGSRTDAERFRAIAKGTWALISGNGRFYLPRWSPTIDEEISRLPLLHQA